MTSHLDAPGHGRVVVEAGIMLSGLVGTRAKIAGRSVVPIARAHIGPKNDSIPLVGLELLFRNVDLDALCFALGCGAGTARWCAPEEGLEDVDVLGSNIGRCDQDKRGSEKSSQSRKIHVRIVTPWTTKEQVFL